MWEDPRTVEEVDMIWAILVLVGVPIWLCALGITALVFRARALRKRPGNIPVRVLRPRLQPVDPRAGRLGVYRLRLAG